MRNRSAPSEEARYYKSRSRSISTDNLEEPPLPITLYRQVIMIYFLDLNEIRFLFSYVRLD